MTHEDQSRASKIDSILHSIYIINEAEKRRHKRIQLANEAKAKLTGKFGPMGEAEMEQKWKEAEELAQLFREANLVGEEFYGKRIIDQVWGSVDGGKVNVHRDSEEGLFSHFEALEASGVDRNEFQKLKEEFHALTGQASRYDQP